jgi:hypothetical protein
MNIENENPCKRVIPIPQYYGTCWFNAILMIVLYSQNMRLFLKNRIKKIEKADEVQKFLFDIINSKFFEINNGNANMFYNKETDYHRPEYILHYLHKLDPERFIKEVPLPEKAIDEVNYEWGFFPEFYMDNFITLFGVKSEEIVMIDYVSETKKFYISMRYLDRFTEEALNNPNFDHMAIEHGTPESEKYYNMIKSYYKNKYKSYKENRCNILIIYYNNNISIRELKGLDSLYEIEPFKIENTITVNNNTFILDSMIFGNYNGYMCNRWHAISGITCHNKKYVYNGWITDTKDPALKEESIKIEENKKSNKILFKLLNNELDKYPNLEYDNTLNIEYLIQLIKVYHRLIKVDDLDWTIAYDNEEETEEKAKEREQKYINVAKEIGLYYINEDDKYNIISIKPLDKKIIKEYGNSTVKDKINGINIGYNKENINININDKKLNINILNYNIEENDKDYIETIRKKTVELNNILRMYYKPKLEIIIMRKNKKVIKYKFNEKTGNFGKKEENDNPCPLFDYDWFDLSKQQKSFCIDKENLCEFKMIEKNVGKMTEEEFEKDFKKKLCFNVNEGNNKHIFIKKSVINPTLIEE